MDLFISCNSNHNFERDEHKTTLEVFAMAEMRKEQS